MSDHLDGQEHAQDHDKERAELFLALVNRQKRTPVCPTCLVAMHERPEADSWQCIVCSHIVNI